MESGDRLIKKSIGIILILLSSLVIILVLRNHFMKVRVTNYNNYRDIEIHAELLNNKELYIKVDKKEKTEILNIINNAKLKRYLEHGGSFFTGEESFTIYIRGNGNTSVPWYYVYHQVDSKEEYRNQTLIQVNDKMYKFKDDKTIENINDYLYMIIKRYEQ